VFKPELDNRDFREKRKKEEKPVEELPREEQVKLKFKLRFDYKGNPRPARFFFGGKKTEDVAEEVREQQITLWRNMPLQGIYVESIDLGDIYNLYDEVLGDEVAYAPLELIVYSDSIEDIIGFIMKEEFRKIEIMQPGTIELSSKEAERLLFKINELLQEKLSARTKETRR